MCDAMSFIGFIVVLCLIGWALEALEVGVDRLFSGHRHDEHLLATLGHVRWGDEIVPEPLASPVAEEPGEEGPGDFLSMLEQIRAQCAPEARRADGRGC